MSELKNAILILAILISYLLFSLSGEALVFYSYGIWFFNYKISPINAILLAATRIIITGLIKGYKKPPKTPTSIRETIYLIMPVYKKLLLNVSFFLLIGHLAYLILKLITYEL